MIVTALITISFMMRNTSPIGWIPLLAVKVLYNQSFLPYLMAAFIIAVPIIGLNVLLDSLYFDSSLKTWTITGYNFMHVNLFEGVSKYFGEDAWHWYIMRCPKEISQILYPFFYVAPFYHIYAAKKTN
mmetsp:Transcript_18583/g.13337  ORF Transcript_18583/g.13337 Transcript_18583/m.13337 type:complete len:128 (-) Transcript_18583:735-1118(-)